jgi:hypothetical protein
MTAMDSNEQEVKACPEWEIELALYPDNLAPTERRRLETHVGQCISCSSVLADYQSIHDFVHDLCTKDPLFKHFLRG